MSQQFSMHVLKWVMQCVTQTSGVVVCVLPTINNTQAAKCVISSLSTRYNNTNHDTLKNCVTLIYFENAYKNTKTYIMWYIILTKHIGSFHNTALLWFVLSKNLHHTSTKNSFTCVLERCIYCVMSDLVRGFDCDIQCVIQCVMNWN